MFLDGGYLEITIEIRETEFQRQGILLKYEFRVELFKEGECFN